MKIGKVNTDKKVFIIAEIGNNHEGNFQLAKKMIIKAAATGVDAVKFQTFIPEKYVSNVDQLRIKKLRSFQLNYDQFNKLSLLAKKKGLIFFSTPFDIESAKFLNTIQPVFKIASGDNNFYPLIETVLSFKKPLIISTGASDIGDIEKLYKKILKNYKLKNNLAFLHCVSSYPVPNNETNLASISYLKKKFPKVVIGYSDHTLGLDAAVSSVIAGARIVEKHFTLDKNYSDFRDHQLSVDPNEMSSLVKKIRLAETMMGKEEKILHSCEKEMNTMGRRSIAVNRDIAKGQKLKKSDFIMLRPGIGFLPDEEKKLLGRKVNRDIKKFEIISKKDIK
jgi:sialic acid synthase SpsE